MGAPARHDMGVVDESALNAFDQARKPRDACKSTYNVAVFSSPADHALVRRRAFDAYVQYVSGTNVFNDVGSNPNEIHNVIERAIGLDFTVLGRAAFRTRGGTAAGWAFGNHGGLRKDRESARGFYRSTRLSRGASRISIQMIESSTDARTPSADAKSRNLRSRRS